MTTENNQLLNTYSSQTAIAKASCRNGRRIQSRERNRANRLSHGSYDRDQEPGQAEGR